MTSAVLRSWQRQAGLLTDVVRLEGVLIKIDGQRARKLSLQPFWAPVGDPRMKLADDVLHAGLQLAEDAFAEGPRLLGTASYPKDDPTFQPPPPRAHVLGATLWSEAVTSAARDPQVQSTIAALAQVMGEPLTPDSRAVRLNSKAPDGNTYEVVLQYSIAPQSKSVTPAAVLVPRGKDEDVFSGPMPDSMLDTFLQLEQVLLQALACELDQYKQRTRANEERDLQNL